MTDIIQELRGLLAEERKALRDMKESGAPNDALLDAWLKASGRLNQASTAVLPDLLDRLEAAESGWQPIETAPHMREVILWADTSVPPFDNWRMASGYFHSEMKVWVWGGEQVREWSFPPTHWRPLPDAPAIREVKP